MLWRGVEAASGARPLLQLCGSVDMTPTRGSSAASEALGAMQDASKVGGGTVGMRGRICCCLCIWCYVLCCCMWLHQG